MNRSIKFICMFFLLCFLSVGLTGCNFSFLSDLYPETIRESKGDSEEDSFETTTSTEYGVNSHLIYIHVCGYVKKPGLYCLEEGSRIDAAIQAAGGFAKGADEKSVNLAELLIDGSQIEVKAKNNDSKVGSTSEEDSGLININEADQNTLTTLSGIGEERAKSIISYREKNGPFSSVEDIRNVEGIGDGIYQKIKNSIIVK